MKKLLILLSTVYAGIAAYLYCRRNDWRNAYCESLLSHTQDELLSAEVEFFQIYNREETRKNIHHAISYLQYSYYEDMALFYHEIWMVQNQVLEDMIADDPEGRVAYYELQEVLQHALEYLRNFTPTPDLLDKMKGGVFEEHKKGTYLKPLHEFENEFEYDPVITPMMVQRRRYPKLELSCEELNEFKRIDQIRRAELGND